MLAGALEETVKRLALGGAVLGVALGNIGMPPGSAAEAAVQGTEPASTEQTAPGGVRDDACRILGRTPTYTPYTCWKFFTCYEFTCEV